MSTFQIENVSGIVRNLDKTTLSTLIKPKDIRIGLTVMDCDKCDKTKNINKLLIYCNKDFFKMFRKYGYIQPMALISITNGTYRIAKDHALEYIFNEKSQFIFIPDPIHIIGLNQSGFSFKNKIDKRLNNNDILRNQLINQYLDFDDTVDYHQYYTNKDNRNQNLWRKYSNFAINVETNPSFDCKQYIANYKKKRKAIKEEENMVYSYDQTTKQIKCSKLNDDKYCKIYQIEPISFDLPLQISLNTKQFNILEQYKKWLKQWYFETSLIDINDRYNRVRIGLYKKPSIKDNQNSKEQELNGFKVDQFKKLLSNIHKLDNIEMTNYIPKYIKNLIKSYKACINHTNIANKDKDENSDSYDDDEESIALTETQPQSMIDDEIDIDIEMDIDDILNEINQTFNTKVTD